MPAGRPPKPIVLHQAQGTFRKDRHKSDAPGFGAPDLSPPTVLVGPAKKEWLRVAPALASAGLLRDADLSALACYCEAVAEFAQAVKELKKSGHTFTTEKGYVVVSPWVGIRNAAADRVAKFGAQFGLSPASRSRVHAPEKPPEKSGKARFFAS